MSFSHPILAWVALGAIPVLALFLSWSWRERRRLVGLFVPARLQASLSVGTTPARALTRAALVIAIVSTLLLALARPRQAGAPVELSQRGLDIILAVDTSRSMLAEDAGPNLSRLQQARLAALDLARLAKSDRLGLIAFAGSAFLQCPLTADVDAFRQSAETLDTEIIPLGGTSFAAALTTATEAFRSSPDHVRVLILLTDGENHEAGALEAARRAADQDIRIFTLGIGTPEGELIRLRDNQGNFAYLKDDQGNVVKSALNEPLLRDIARAGNGLYLPLQGPRTMDELYQRGLAPLPRADLDSRVFDQYRELYQWPLALALLLLALEFLLPERPRSRGTLRASTTRHPTLSRTVTLAPLLLALCLLPLTLPATSPSQALRLFESGDYPAAEQAYNQLAQQHPDDPRYRFNAGTSAYRAGAFDRALEHFNQSLRSPDLAFQHDAFYNLGNAHFHAGAQAPDPQARRQHWQNALQSYENALRLQTNSPNAQHNLQFVRQQLESLQNPPPQPDQSQDSQEQQEPEDQENDAQQNQPQPSDNSQPPAEQQPQPSTSQDNQDSQPQPQSQPPQPDENPESRETPPQPSETGDDQSTPPPAEGGDQGEDPSDTTPTDPSDLEPPKDMTREQALRLLDAARGEEKTTPPDQRPARHRPRKDW